VDRVLLQAGGGGDLADRSMSWILGINNRMQVTPLCSAPNVRYESVKPAWTRGEIACGLSSEERILGILPNDLTLSRQWCGAVRLSQATRSPAAASMILLNQGVWVDRAENIGAENLSALFPRRQGARASWGTT
jgi:hypothetical protein